MSDIPIWKNDARMNELVEEQRALFISSKLLHQLPSIGLLESTVETRFMNSPSLYRGIPAEIIDNPNQDTITALIDRPTVEDMVEEFVQPDALCEEDVLRLYVGAGLSSLLILNSLRPTRVSRVKRFYDILIEKYVAELCDPPGMFVMSMGEKLFDEKSAGEIVNEVARDGHAHTARINSTRLITGMFIEVQPQPESMREAVSTAFQGGLSGLLDGKTTYLKTVGLFGVSDDDAKDIHLDTIETLMGLSLPMAKKEIQGIVRILS